MNLREWPHMAAIWTRGALTNSDLFVSGRFWVAVSVILPIMFLTLSYLLWNWLSDSQLGLWTEANVVAFYSWLNASESPSTTIRNVGFVIAGLIALPLTIWRSLVADRQASAARDQADSALRQADSAQQGLLNERYQKGAEMLGSEVLSVRMGGIYALQRLAEEHPKQYHVQIMRLFCAFARHPKKDQEHETEPSSDETLLGLREDVQAIMERIGSRDETRVVLEKEAKYPLNLYRANLQNANLPKADLSGALLYKTVLSDANLQNANLSGARLWDADLTGTALRNANLSRANLSRDYPGSAHLPATGLTQAQLDEACADPDNPPRLDGVLDAETDEPLVWRDKPCDKNQELEG